MRKSQKPIPTLEQRLVGYRQTSLTVFVVGLLNIFYGLLFAYHFGVPHPGPYDGLGAGMLLTFALIFLVLPIDIIFVIIGCHAFFKNRELKPQRTYTIRLWLGILICLIPVAVCLFLFLRWIINDIILYELTGERHYY